MIVPDSVKLSALEVITMGAYEDFLSGVGKAIESAGLGKVLDEDERGGVASITVRGPHGTYFLSIQDALDVFDQSEVDTYWPDPSAPSEEGLDRLGMDPDYDGP